MTGGAMLLRLLVAAQGSLNPAWPAGMPWNYEISYMTIGEKRCNMADFGNYLEVFSDSTFVDDLGASIQSRLCVSGDAGYCAMGSAGAHCAGDDSTQGTNYAFCGTEHELRLL